MATFLAFLAVAAACVAIFVAFAVSTFFRRLVLQATQHLFALVVFLCRQASRVADFVLSPRGSTIASGKYAVWIALNLAPLALVLAFNAPAVVSALPAGLPLSDLGYLLVIAGLFQALVLGASCIALYDDYDVMEGLVPVERRRIGGSRVIAGAPLIAIGLALFFVYAVAVVYWLAEIEHLALFVRRPETGAPVVDYALVALWSLPTGVILRPIDWVFGADTRVVFNATFAARAYFVGAFTLGWLLFAGFAALLLQVAWQTRRAVIGLGAMQDGDHRQIMARIRLAPRAVKGGVLSAATLIRDEARQKRLLEAARDLNLLTFPLVFCRNLERYDEEIQCFGLERALELYRQHASEFDRTQCESLIHRTARHLERGRLPCETLKRMVRLMVAVLASKCQVLNLDERVKDSLLAQVARELKTPRENPDPAYRGLLQDLRGAVMRLTLPLPIPPESSEWIRRLAPGAAEDRSARHDTPQPTAL